MLIPILMSSHVGFAATPTVTCTARVGAEAGRAQCDRAVSCMWHVHWEDPDVDQVFLGASHS